MRCCIIALFLCSPAFAQDMPLSTILKEGEGWRPFSADFQTTGAGGPQLRSKERFQYDVLSDPPAVLISRIVENQPDLNPRKHPVPFNRVGPMVFWPDQRTLVVADRSGRHLWAFRIEKDGSLSAGEKYYPLRGKIIAERTAKNPNPGADEVVETTALCVDGANRLYAATAIGIQIFDPTGRLCGVMTNPASGKVTDMGFAGTDKDELIVRCGDKIFARKMLARGIGAPELPKKK